MTNRNGQKRREDETLGRRSDVMCRAAREYGCEGPGCHATIAAGEKFVRRVVRTSIGQAVFVLCASCSERECGHCGRPYYPTISRLDGFCSRSCQAAYRYRRTKLPDRRPAGAGDITRGVLFGSSDVVVVGPVAESITEEELSGWPELPPDLQYLKP